jgi:RNA polymerase sigma-70 factor (ECF subfamily)
MEAPQDKAIAAGLREGRREAWHALYDAYAERIWRSVARWMSGHEADTADVVQETFLAAARSAHGYDPERGSLWSWLSGIARNHVALFFRRQSRQDPLLHRANRHVVQIGRWLDGQDALPEGELVSAELRVLVRRTLARLSRDHEWLLSAKYMDGASVEQIAADRACSTTAVRSKLARARKAFRRALATTAPDLIDSREERHES